MTGAADGLDPESHQREALDRIAAAPNEGSLEELRVQFLGRKAVLSEELSRLGGMPADQRREAGARLNRVKATILQALESRRDELRKSGGGTLAAVESIDLTFPGQAPRRGHAHPVMRVWREMEDIFRGLGYDVARGPEVDNDYYTFEALNMP
ncbi:MAG TPA: phenylalanine--tRNA ligase subunit alpha, partial [Candidatus Dormibacteraeota bacterium]|nr:phenylalanine--tRNA ligase subunit alpha [Candidatus Dormibacteraeota bacterium]